MDNIQEPDDNQQRLRARVPDLNRAYGRYFRELRDAVYRHNPLRISRRSKLFEYLPVMATILARREEARTYVDLRHIIYGEFQGWCEKTIHDVGSESRYDKFARRVWWSWQQIIPEDNGRQEELYAQLYYSALLILSKHDPIHIGYLPDEYIPEVETILPRLEEVDSKEGARRMIHEEFIHWFGNKTAGPESNYEGIALDVWALWQRWRKTITQ